MSHVGKLRPAILQSETDNTFKQTAEFPTNALTEALLDFTALGNFTFDLHFLSALVSIIIIDLILAGDNAVVIAMAVRSLPPHQRKKGIIFGAGAAVLLRVVLTFFVSQLLAINYLKIIGGLLILWIAIKLFIEGLPEENCEKTASTLGQAIKVIVIADITMATDNMLAVGGASQGNIFLLIFGLGLSIPFVVLTSNLLSTLMDKYPIIIYFGAAILGNVGGEMLLTDPLTISLVHLSPTTQYLLQALFAIGVILLGKLFIKLKSLAKEELQENARS